MASLVAQMVKHLPAMQETWVQSLGWEASLEKETATHSSTLAWKIPWTEEAGRLQSMGSQKVGCDWATSLSSGIIKCCLVASFYYALWIILSLFCFSIDYFFLWWIWFQELTPLWIQICFLLCSTPYIQYSVQKCWHLFTT